MKNMLVKCLDKYRESQLNNAELANLIWAYFLTERGWHIPLTRDFGRLDTARRLISMADEVLYSGDHDKELTDFDPTGPVDCSKGPQKPTKKTKKK